MDVGMPNHRQVDQRKSMAEIFLNRKILVLSPNCSPPDLYTRYPGHVMIRNEWKDILAELKDGSSGQTVAIFPNGSLQFTPPL
jgi:hypothetical protein